LNGNLERTQEPESGLETTSEDGGESLSLVEGGPAGRRAADAAWAVGADGAGGCRSEGRLGSQRGGGGKGPLEIG